jgi:hypothetical protein
MKLVALCFALLVVLILAIIPQGMTFAGAASEKSAVAAAEAWLKLVDNGKYAESWETVAELFKNSVDKGQWSKTVAAVREPLGKVLQRKVKSKQFMASLPGAPDGKYVVIQFDTSFENKKTAIETITPILDKDGKWRVSGYYMR